MTEHLCTDWKEVAGEFGGSVYVYMLPCKLGCYWFIIVHPFSENTRQKELPPKGNGASINRIAHVLCYTAASFFFFLSTTLTNRTALRKRVFAHASSSIEDDCTDTPSFIEKRTFFFFFSISKRASLNRPHY